MTRNEYKEKIYNIIGAAMDVQNELGHSLNEAVYQEAMSIELKQRGIANEREKCIDIYYKGQTMEKQYKMDLMADDIIIELKSSKTILPEHRSQLCNYLRITHKPIGILINFGEKVLHSERWAYETETGECFPLDNNLNKVVPKSSND